MRKKINDGSMDPVDWRLIEGVHQYAKDGDKKVTCVRITLSFEASGFICLLLSTKFP